MNKAKLRFRYYLLVCKIGSRLSSWYKILGKHVRAPREKMNFVMIPIEKKVKAPDQHILPMDVVDAMVDKAGAAAIAHTCACREGGRCKDYPQDIGCLILGEAVKELDPVIGKMVTKDEAKAHIKKALDAGLYPLISHYFRDAMMYSIDFEREIIVCFCCPCHCVARRAATESEGLEESFYTNTRRFPGVEVMFDESKCTACGKCVQQCFARAITLEDGKIRFDADKCKGCGHCALVCDGFTVRYDLNSVDEVIKQLEFTSKYD